MAKCKPEVTPLLTHWRYCSHALSHQHWMNPSGAVAEYTFREKKNYDRVVDALAPGFTRTLTDLLLTMKDKRILVIERTRFE